MEGGENGSNYPQHIAKNSSTAAISGSMRPQFCMPDIGTKQAFS